MLPTLRADQIFPGRCKDYTTHLGSHQAEAFTLLWNLLDATDPVGNLDSAAWHIHRQLSSNEGLKIAPAEISSGLFDGSARLQGEYPERATALDLTYAGLFVMIAQWQHELLAENIAELTDSYYHGE